jgi:hypothetical protein
VLVSSQHLIYINIIIKMLLQVLINCPVIMGIINSSRSRTSLFPHSQFLLGRVPWLQSIMIPLVWMSATACPMITSMSFLSLAFFWVPMRYDGQNTSPLGKQWRLLVFFISCFHPLPLPSPTKNGETFLSAAWNLNHWTPLVQMLTNMLVVYLDQQLII